MLCTSTAHSSPSSLYKEEHCVWIISGDGTGVRASLRVSVLDGSVPICGCGAAVAATAVQGTVFHVELTGECICNVCTGCCCCGWAKEQCTWMRMPAQQPEHQVLSMSPSTLYVRQLTAGPPGARAVSKCWSPARRTVFTCMKLQQILITDLFASIGPACMLADLFSCEQAAS